MDMRAGDGDNEDSDDSTETSPFPSTQAQVDAEERVEDDESSDDLWGDSDEG